MDFVAKVRIFFPLAKLVWTKNVLRNISHKPLIAFGGKENIFLSQNRTMNFTIEGLKLKSHRNLVGKLDTGATSSISWFSASDSFSNTNTMNKSNMNGPLIRSASYPFVSVHCSFWRCWKLQSNWVLWLPPWEFEFSCLPVKHAYK